MYICMYVCMNVCILMHMCHNSSTCYTYIMTWVELGHSYFSRDEVMQMGLGVGHIF